MHSLLDEGLKVFLNQQANSVLNTTDLSRIRDPWASWNLIIRKSITLIIAWGTHILWRRPSWACWGRRGEAHIASRGRGSPRGGIRHHEAGIARGSSHCGAWIILIVCTGLTVDKWRCTQWFGWPSLGRWIDCWMSRGDFSCQGKGTDAVWGYPWRLSLLQGDASKHVEGLTTWRDFNWLHPELTNWLALSMYHHELSRW